MVAHHGPSSYPSPPLEHGLGRTGRRDAGNDRCGCLRLRLRLCRRLGFDPVDEILQLFARLEVRHLLGRHVHLVTRLRIASLAWLTLPQPEAAEAAKLDLLAAVQGVDNRLEHRVDDQLRVLLGEVRHARNFFDELRLGHAASHGCRHSPLLSCRKWSPSVAPGRPVDSLYSSQSERYSASFNARMLSPIFRSEGTSLMIFIW